MRWRIIEIFSECSCHGFLLKTANFSLHRYFKNKTKSSHYRTTEAISMPRLIQCFEPAVTATNDHLAGAALDTEELLVILSTVRLAAVQMKALVRDLFATVGADEMLRVEHLSDSFYTRLQGRKKNKR